MSGVDQIRAERVRQIHSEHYTEKKDKGRQDELARAAHVYLEHYHCQINDPEGMYDLDDMESAYLWPWDTEYWKPSGDNPKRTLIKAGALIAAAIDALQQEETHE